MDRINLLNISHKQWRRNAKKERRRKIRQRDARARDYDAERLNEKLKESREYLNWIETQRVEDELKAEQEEKEHEIRERQWLEEEVRAQKEWRIQQERRAKARQEQQEQEAKIREEFEAKQEALRQKKEEALRREEEESKRLEEVRRKIDEYIDEGTSTPEVLREVKNTQLGKELCPFFSKTGACRYGDTCSRNHQRVALSQTLLIPAFYFHFSLEKNSAEYDTDVALEFDSSETRRHFREFYNDVVPELESFGKIKTFRCCRNTEIHLRGNVYVEYYSEREAARALRSLKGRWYAGRQLNCEFVNLKSWRNAVCGMPNCPKGRACNFLHTFRNPRDEYDVKSPPRSRRSQNDQRTGSARSSRLDQESARAGGWQHQQLRDENSRNWRWSESPEPAPESPQRVSRLEDKRRGRDSGRSPRQKHEKKARTEPTKVKKRKRGGESEDKEDKATSRRSSSHRNGKSRSGASSREKLRETKRSKDRSRKSEQEIREKRSKWDNSNAATDSEGDSNRSTTASSKRRRKKMPKRSRSRSWSDGEPGEVAETQLIEKNVRRSETSD